MAYEWQTVEAAALTLGISTRTLGRRISEGKIESRLVNGRREVFVCLSDPEPGDPSAAVPAMPETTVTIESGDPDTPGVPVQTITAHVYPPAGKSSHVSHGSHGGHAGGQGGHGSAYLSSDLALAEDRLAMAEERIRCAELTVSAFRQHAELAREEVRRAKLGALWAWGTVAAMAAGVVGVVGWTTAKVTQSQAQSQFLSQEMGRVSAEHHQALSAQEALRREAEEAKLAAARSQGQMDAFQQQRSADRAERLEPGIWERLATAVTEGRPEATDGSREAARDTARDGARDTARAPSPDGPRGENTPRDAGTPEPVAPGHVVRARSPKGDPGLTPQSAERLGLDQAHTSHATLPTLPTDRQPADVPAESAQGHAVGDRAREASSREPGTREDQRQRETLRRREEQRRRDEQANSGR